MADLAKIILPSGDEYNFKDAQAREKIQSELDGETSTVTGDIVTFETESAQVLPSVVVDIDPVQDLHGYDNPWPAGGGKNLFSGWEDVSSSYATSYRIPVDFTSNTYYTVSGLDVNHASWIYAYDNNNVFVGRTPGKYITALTVSKTSFSYGSGTKDYDSIAYIVIEYYNWTDITRDDVEALPTQFEIGSTATTYAPYSNICPISGWDGCTVERVGKNLFDADSANFKDGYYLDSSGIEQSHSYYKYTQTYMDILPSTTYCIQAYNNSGNVACMVCLYDSNKRFLERVTGYSATSGEGIKSGSFTTSASAHYIRFSLYRQISNIMLEIASTASPYEPYQNSTYSISFPSSAGTVYGGTLDVTNGLLTVTHKYAQLSTYVLNTEDPQDGLHSWWVASGSMRWNYASNISDSQYSKITAEIKRAASNSDVVAVVSNQFEAVSPNATYAGTKGISVATSGVIGISFGVSSMTAAQVRALLDANSVQICYPLATPVTYQLTPTQVTALLGQNNLWADTGDSTVIYRTGKLALLSDVADSEERVREDLNTKIDSLAATDVCAAKDSSIANVEPTSTASTNYAVGDHLMLGGVLYKVTVPIASGETIIQGTNVTPVTVMESMVELDTRLSANIQLASEAASIGIPYDGVDLTVKFASEIAQYTDPWAWIKARITAEDWSGLRIGDYIPFTTTESSPKTYRAQIAGINTYKSYGNTAVGNHIDFICRELWATRHPVNPVNFNNGTKFGDAEATEYPWLASDLYLYLNSLSGKVPNATTVGGGTGTDVDYTSGGVYYYLPAALKSQIVEKLEHLPKRYSASGLLPDDNAGGWTNIGKLWLPSEFEVYGAPVFGGKSYALSGNCVQYPIFAHNMNRVKKRSGGRDTWWVLSTYSGTASSWCYANLYGAASVNLASNQNVTAPICFRIA